MFQRVQAVLGVMFMCVALVFSGGVSAQVTSEDCVVSQAGNSIAERMGALSTQNVRRAITPALRKYNLGCLARTINLGGFGRIGSGIGSAIRRIIGNISADALCQVILDAVTYVEAPQDGAFAASAISAKRVLVLGRERETGA